MLKKIIAIRNLGRFKLCVAVGDVEFRRTTLIYAPNARGKTTFCDICRSLKTGTPDPILGRARLGAGAKPSVDLRLDNEMAKFEDEKWTRTLPELEIFDSRFVFDNVYAGESVEHYQRRNLYEVIIGEKGVALRGKVDQLDDEFRKAGQVLDEKEIAVRNHITSGVDVAKFIAIEEDPGIAGKIEEKAKQVAALESAAELIAKPNLAEIPLPEFPEGLETVLAKTLKDVEKGAEASIRKHMEDHMQRPNEAWLVEGTKLLKGKACPYCEKPLKGSPIVELYKTHFAGKYDDLKVEIQEWVNRVRNVSSDSALLLVERTWHENNRLLGEWQKYLSGVESPLLDVPKVHAALMAIRDAALDLLEMKAKSPLDPIALSEEFATAKKLFDASSELVGDYTTSVIVVNGLIAAKKEEAENGDVAKLKLELEEIRQVEIRFRPEVVKAVEELRIAKENRATITAAKQAAKSELEEYSRDVFQRYQGNINRYLDRFGAAFHIEKAREHYPGGKPSSTYCLSIEGEEVELGDASTPLAKPSFKNTLSAGDRSALALAFFLAQLDESAELKKKIVIFDDPFTSQDASRQTCTQQEIRRIAGVAAQVVVLSHDPRFLKLVWDEMETTGIKTLQFSDLGDTRVTEWDIEEAVQDSYAKTYNILWEYCHHNVGDPDQVVAKIRILLEGYLRMKLPREFSPTKWLGDYVKLIEEAEPNSVVGQAKQLLPELVDLKDYAKRYHHPAGPEFSNDPVDAVEVRSYGKRALKIVTGF